MYHTFWLAWKNVRVIAIFIRKRACFCDLHQHLFTLELDQRREGHDYRREKRGPWLTLTAVGDYKKRKRKTAYWYACFDSARLQYHSWFFFFVQNPRHRSSDGSRNNFWSKDSFNFMKFICLEWTQLTTTTITKSPRLCSIAPPPPFPKQYR